MKTGLIRMARDACAMFFALCLSACAGYDVLQASGQPTRPLEKNSIRVHIKGGQFVKSVESHQRVMHGATGPSITQEDKILSSAKADLVKLNLEGNLVGKVSSRLAPYVAQNYAAKHTLNLELKRIAADTDGSRNVTITATLLETWDANEIWWRTIKVSGSRFNSDDAITNEISNAIYEQMKLSSLID